jgi:hypothetical protein
MSWRAAAPSALLLLGATLLFTANGRDIGSGDTLPARYLPWSIARGSFTLDAFPELHAATARAGYPLLDGVPYFLVYRGGHYLSAYGPGPAVLALPVYAPAILAGAPPAAWAARLEKLSASLITALSVVLLFQALRPLASLRWALAISLVYALGTSSLSVSSQALWQHGPSQLCVALMLCWLVRGLGDERWLARSGLAMSAAVCLRATDLLLVLPVAGWIAITRPRLAARLVLWGLPPVAALLVYNAAVAGSPLGPRGDTGAPLWALFAQTPFAGGLAGVLVSPGRGLFVYSPVLLFSILGAVLVWRRGPAAFRALALGPPLVILVVGKWFLWWGGHSWGPRLLADTTPVLCFLLYPVPAVLSRRAALRAAFVVLAVLSVGAHALGALLYDRRWDALAGVERSPAALWSWRESPLAFYGREAWAGIARTLPEGPRGPTSADAPELLSATYRMSAVGSEAVAGQPLPLSLSAANTGRAVWLARALGDRGAVRLGWRWERGGAQVAAGRFALASDVPPGRSITLAPVIPVPPAPGEYTLELDLVSEHVVWFGTRGSQPVRLSMHVRALDLDRVLAAPAPDAGGPVRARIGTDRREYRDGDVLRLEVDLWNPLYPRSFDGYLVLRGPQGGAAFFDGRALTAAAERWPAWVTGLPLPARVAGRFAVPLRSAAPGRYAWHVVLTDPGSYESRVSASTEFSVVP